MIFLSTFVRLGLGSLFDAELLRSRLELDIGESHMFSSKLVFLDWGCVCMFVYQSLLLPYVLCSIYINIMPFLDMISLIFFFYVLKMKYHHGQNAYDQLLQ